MNKKQEKKVIEFLQFILDKWDLDTKETQDKALELLKELKK